MRKNERDACRRAYIKWKKADFEAFCKAFSLDPKDADLDDEMTRPTKSWKVAFEAGIEFERRRAK